MRSIRVPIAVGCVVALLALPVSLRADAPLRLVVRLYNGVSLAGVDIDAARGAAESILRDTGIEVSFRYCRMASPGGGAWDNCEEPRKPGEIVVRIINAPDPSVALDLDALGSSYVLKSTDQGWLATVYADSVASAASRAGVDRRTLMGLVLAHEVGHLLLGPGHASAGLMSAQWPDAALRRGAQSNWRFSTDEAATMQERLLDR